MRWQPTSPTADQHLRMTVEPAVLRRQAERRHQSMPIVVKRDRPTLAQKLDNIGAVAFFAVPFAAYCFGTTGAVVTALLVIAGAVTEWALARRPL